MSYSQENRAAAIVATQGKTGAQKRTSVLPAGPTIATEAVEHEERDPRVSFHAEKKVGDFTFTTYGEAGQEDKAKAALDKAAANLRADS
jgi:hypothetical protein